MDTSNSAKISVSDLEETKINSKTARCIQHSLSKAMAEALYQPHTMLQPKPMASRVKDAGKDFLRHNQTCQWIQFMQEPPEPTDYRKRVVKVTPSRETKPAPVKEVELSAPPVIEPPPSMQQSSPSYEEQLLSLHRQQEELMGQQRYLEGQMEQEKLARQLLPIVDLQPKPKIPETPEVIEPAVVCPMKPRTDDTGANNCPPSRFRRRLKGSIAQSFAERDEGSIGSLLYNTKGQETLSEKKSDISSTSYRRYARPNLEGRHYASWQESSSNLSQLLSQTPCCSSCDSVRHASESSGTITDTLLTELTIDDRKCGHGDF
ncbi:unnamed protein product [Candidula unifasciata]|uniref:Uncharacterized protein n=1 Tax=Candidula unifasciata TaxID=100452 RepID=A0A8S3Z929_9EUPU|nr:unnamed protein product [Candidula unifasciata]